MESTDEQQSQRCDVRSSVRCNGRRRIRRTRVLRSGAIETSHPSGADHVADSRRELPGRRAARLRRGPALARRWPVLPPFVTTTCAVVARCDDDRSVLWRQPCLAEHDAQRPESIATDRCRPAGTIAERSGRASSRSACDPYRGGAPCPILRRRRVASPTRCMPSPSEEGCRVRMDGGTHRVERERVQTDIGRRSGETRRRGWQ
jgi:hypothetical protein